MKEEQIFQNLMSADCYYDDIDELDPRKTLYMASAMHSHNYNEICLVLNGHSKIISKKSIMSQKDNYIIFYPAYVPHMQINDVSGGYRRYIIRYDNSLINSALLSSDAYRFVSSANDVFSVKLEDSEKELLVSASELLCKLSKYTSSPKDYHSRDLMLSVVLDMVSKIISDKPELSLRHGKYTYIGEVLAYLATNFMKKINSTELAEMFFISRAKLMNDFKQVTGDTLANYILKIRLEHSLILMRNGDSLAEISEKCGFSSVSYFVNRFGKHYGMTPLKYRKLHLSDE